MKGNIERFVSNFHNQLVMDTNHRYKSWEHCYTYFLQDDANINLDIACLHLSFYLASWGMYRGSSFLLWKDYLIHKEVVRTILKNKQLQQIDFSVIDDVHIQEIIVLTKWIKNWYSKNIEMVSGEKKKITATDTLVTKILLGTLGCIPAYDRYFIDGMRQSGISYSHLTEDNLKSIVAYYQKNKDEFDNVQRIIFKTSNIHYPTMKLVDMYFWEIGFQADKKHPEG